MCNLASQIPWRLLSSAMSVNRGPSPPFFWIQSGCVFTVPQNAGKHKDDDQRENHGQGTARATMVLRWDVPQTLMSIQLVGLARTRQGRGVKFINRRRGMRSETSVRASSKSVISRSNPFHLQSHQKPSFPTCLSTVPTCTNY